MQGPPAAAGEQERDSGHREPRVVPQDPADRRDQPEAEGADPAGPLPDALREVRPAAAEHDQG